MPQLKKGWTNEPYGTLCQFEHCSTEEARKQHSLKEMPHVVETINWTLVDKRTVHHNRYYATNLPTAIGLAAQIEFGSQEVAEEVIRIRPAGAEEILAHHRVMGLAETMPKPNLTEVVVTAQNNLDQRLDHGFNDTPDASLFELDVKDRPDLTRLKKHLLKHGGKGFQRNDFIAAQIPLELAAALMAKGTCRSGKAVSLVQMEPNNCHDNAATLAKTKGMDLWMGFGLYDKIWRIHSWCVQKQRLIETTGRQERYFGIRIPLTTRD